MSDSDIKDFITQAAERVANEYVATIAQQKIDWQHKAEELKKQLDSVYKERDMLVALAAHLADKISAEAAIQHDLSQSQYETIQEVRQSYFAWLGRHEDKEGEQWDEDWKNVVFIRIPTGQLTWHIHDSELFLFNRLYPDPRGAIEKWDGHTTEEKYDRIRKFCGGVES